MSKKTSMCKLAGISAGVIAAVNMASASTVQYTYTGETGGGVIIGLHTADYAGNALVGQFIMTTSNPNFQSTLDTYCTDVGVFLNNSFTYTPTDLSSASGVKPAWISGGIQNAATLWYNDKSAATTAAETAGLQLAIWELLYNNLTGNVTTSIFSNHANKGFYVTSTDANTLEAENYASTLLNNRANLTTEQNVEWLAPTEGNGTIGGSQGLLYETSSPPTYVPVPETFSTLGLLGVVVVGLSAAGRRFRKT
jgi:hypothetical protein